MEMEYRVGLATAKIVKASIYKKHFVVYSVQCRYPRFVHAELMTHRVFGRNARSSRAVPIKVMLEEISNEPVVPIHWGANQPGMQAKPGDHNEPVHIALADGTTYAFSRESAWLMARNSSLRVAAAYAEAGYHKQIPNRLLEPFMNIDTLVTSVHWKDFFDLRIHPDAEPHMKDLAMAIHEAMAGTRARAEFSPLKMGQWHLPYINAIDENEFNAPIREQVMVSAARCARISYKPFDAEKADWDKDLELGERLLISRHMSPFDHQALAVATAPVEKSRHFYGSLYECARSYLGF